MSQKELVQAAIAEIAMRGASTPPGSGGAVAAYLNAHCEQFTVAEVRHLLGNLQRTLDDLRARVYLVHEARR
jgi:hypothetical protein